MFSPLEQFDAIRLISLNIFNLDLSFFNIVIPMILLISVFWIVITLLKNNFSLVPTSIQYLFELVFEFIFNLIKQQIGREGYLFFPFIFTLFNFVLICNLISLIPFGIALTSHIIMIMWLSLSICLSIFITGLYIHNVQFLKIFIPECPFVLLPILILIEIFSYIIRSFSLAIRLSANIMAGHTLVFIVSTFVINITKIKWWFFFLGLNFIVAILFLELGVAFLQAYVFSVLVCIYLNDAIKGASH